ncbi:MAG: C40 family peptidase [Burkholderiales bacterium]|nr:C40 family peptidase [Burkholderiales bacterium]
MRRLAVFLLVAILAGCGSAPLVEQAPPAPSSPFQAKRDEVVMYALGLMDTDYRFGGANPSSGLDCSGMVSYIYRNAVGMRLPHNAYSMAKMVKRVGRRELKPGDLVFFNTLHRPYSHVGIYIGKGRFVHAPGTNGKIRISHLDSGYFSRRYEGAGTLFY